MIPRKWRSRTMAERVNEWNENQTPCAASDCSKLAFRLRRYCCLHTQRYEAWGSPTIPPRWDVKGDGISFRSRRISAECLIARELRRGNPVVRRAVEQVERWIKNASEDFAKLGGDDGLRFISPKRRSWVRLWYRIGLNGSATRALAYVLMLYEPEMVYDHTRPEAQAGAVTHLLKSAANGHAELMRRRHAGTSRRRGRQKRPAPITPSAHLAIGRRVLQALAPMMLRCRTYLAERAIGRPHPRPRPHAFRPPHGTRGRKRKWQGRRKLTPEQLEAARQMRSEGATYAAIGKRFGVTDRCISISLRRLHAA